MWLEVSHPRVVLLLRCPTGLHLYAHVPVPFHPDLGITAWHKLVSSPWGLKNCVLTNTDQSINVVGLLAGTAQQTLSQFPYSFSLLSLPNLRYFFFRPQITLLGKTPFKCALIQLTCPNIGGNLYLENGFSLIVWNQALCSAVSSEHQSGHFPLLAWILGEVPGDI